MKVTIYYQNRIENSWKGFQQNPNGSITIEDPKQVILSAGAERHNKNLINDPFSLAGFIEIKGDLRKGTWFPISHEDGSASDLSSSTFVLWD